MSLKIWPCPCSAAAAVINQEGHTLWACTYAEAKQQQQFISYMRCCVRYHPVNVWLKACHFSKCERVILQVNSLGFCRNVIMPTLLRYTWDTWMMQWIPFLCVYVFSGFLASVYGFTSHSYTDHVKKAYSPRVWQHGWERLYISEPQVCDKVWLSCLSEPKINASDQIILPLDGSIKPVWLKCNLTTAQTPHKDSFWMKNGQEITNTRTEQRNTAYR